MFWAAFFEGMRFVAVLCGMVGVPWIVIRAAAELKRVMKG
jgi:hypothetical protein